jgi:hypothetical protein
MSMLDYLITPVLVLVTNDIDVNEYAGLFDNTCTSVSYLSNSPAYSFTSIYFVTNTSTGVIK